MYKLKERFNFDLSQNYTYYSIYSDALFLNKKLNLLYNFWNKRKEFFLLKKKKSRYNINYQGFFSLNINLDSINNIILKKSDYFTKWSSSFFIYTDLIIRHFFENENKNKKLIESRTLIDYTIFDDIFYSYAINDKKRFFYFYKNKLSLNFFFKLSKRDNLMFKDNMYIYLFDYLLLLNNNYYYNVYCYNWKNNYNLFFFKKVLINLKFNIVKYIKKKINFYFFFKVKLLLKKIYMLYFFFNRKKFFFPNIFKKKFFFRNYFNNKNENKFFRINAFFKNIYFLKKFYKRYYKRYSKLYIKRKRRWFFKPDKERILWMLKEKFLPSISSYIYKILKRRNYFSFLNKLKKKNNFFFLRNFYSLNSLMYNFSFKDKKLKNRKIRKKIKMEYRALKKLRTFYYIPDKKKTKRKVFNRFRRSVIYKFKRKRKKKIKAIYTGLRFNLFVYNARKRYKNWRKLLNLKKKSTPNFFFFNNKKNNYINSSLNVIKLKHKDLSYYLIKGYKLAIKKDEPKHFYFKKKKYALRRCFDKIREDFLLKKKNLKELKYDLKYLYKNRTQRYYKNKFLKYLFNLRKSWHFLKLKEKKKKKKIILLEVERLNRLLNRKKKNFWFIQRIVLYWRDLLKLKKNKSFININYLINISLLKLQSIYKTCFLIIIQLFIIIKKQKYNIYIFIDKLIYIIKTSLLIFIKFLSNFIKLYNLKNYMSILYKFKKYLKLKRKKKFKKKINYKLEKKKDNNKDNKTYWHNSKFNYYDKKKEKEKNKKFWKKNFYFFNKYKYKNSNNNYYWKRKPFFQNKWNNYNYFNKNKKEYENFNNKKRKNLL